jgi:hypothetical protein
MVRRRHSRREILQATAALTAAASFGAMVGRAAAAQPHAQIDTVLRRATEAKEVPGVVAVAATDKECSTRARSACGISPTVPR